MLPSLIDLGATVAVLGSFASITWGILAVVLVFVCLLLIAVILIQDPKGGGLTSAFGSAPGGESVLGARAQRDVTIWTSGLTLIFLVIVIVMVLFDPDKWESAADKAGPKGPAVQAATDPDAGAGAVELPAQPEESSPPQEALPPVRTETDGALDTDGAPPSEPAPPTEPKSTGQE